MELRCLKCGKKPEELQEYVDAAHEEECSVEEYVIRSEGTFNHNTGYFWCTPCYVEIGMPLGKAREGYGKADLYPYPDTEQKMANFVRHLISIKDK